MIVAIYCAWDGLELLRPSIDNIRKCGVDEVVIVYSNSSNYGENMEFPTHEYADCHLVQFDPKQIPGGANETMKRNFGLAFVKKLSFKASNTMFIMLDCDEFYIPQDFRMAIDFMKEFPMCRGIVCKSKVYFKKPTLSIGFDTTYVTALHRLTPGLEFSFNYPYPYTWDENVLRIDPTRRLNIDGGIVLTGLMEMHHYSWCRKDIDQKIRNSTAPNLRKNREAILLDLQNAGPGVKCTTYEGKVLNEVEDYFGLAHLFIKE